MLKRTFQTLAAISPLVIAGAASATTITADSSWSGHSFSPSSGITVTACKTVSSCAEGDLGSRDIPGVGLGVGVQGNDNNEIDWYGGDGSSEMLRFNFDTASVIESLELGLLFDGPEYTDFLERATFSVTYAAGGVSTFSLIPNYGTGTASWVGGSGTWNGTFLENDQAGKWLNSTNPFGSGAITQLDMYASEGSCGVGSCYDQSDYVFRSLTATPLKITQTDAPEPATLLLLGTGLAGMGAATRRRRKSVA